MVKSYSGAIACCGYLTSNQNVLIYTTYIKKVIARFYSFILRRKQPKNNNRSEISLDTGHRTSETRMLFTLKIQQMNSSAQSQTGTCNASIAARLRTNNNSSLSTRHEFAVSSNLFNVLTSSQACSLKFSKRVVP